MISMEDWAEIRQLHGAEQMPVRAIARKLGIGRNTVRRAIADDAPPKGSIVDAVSTDFLRSPVADTSVVLIHFLWGGCGG